MGHHHHNHHDADAGKNISIVFFLNLFFVIIEVIGGILTNSVAILSDAVHDIGDCLSLGVSWILQKKSSKSRDFRYSYGYKRYSLLGSVFLSGILLISSTFVLIKAFGRLVEPEVVNSTGMLWLAVLGIIINGAAALKVKKGHSLNERSVYLHIMEDVLGWAAVLVASIVMKIWELPILDPILSIAISIWVLTNVFRNLNDVMKVFLQAVPEDVEILELQHKISGIPGVLSTHDLHIWSLDGESHIMTIHIVLDMDADSAAIRKEINRICKESNITHTTVEFETKESDCEMNCDTESQVN